MSKITETEKEIISKFLNPNAEVLEVFPGDNYDSIYFLSNLVKKPIFGFGDYPSKWYLDVKDKINYLSIKAPPFPNYNFKFDIIFICELCWIVIQNAKFVELEDSNLLKDFIIFLKKNLKSDGKIIFTRTSYFELIIFGKNCAKLDLNFIFDFPVDSYSQPVFVLKRNDSEQMLKTFEFLHNKLISK